MTAGATCASGGGRAPRRCCCEWPTPGAPWIDVDTVFKESRMRRQVAGGDGPDLRAFSSPAAIAEHKQTQSTGRSPPPRTHPRAPGGPPSSCSRPRERLTPASSTAHSRAHLPIRRRARRIARLTNFDFSVKP
jgi:hypothetical protein